MNWIKNWYFGADKNNLKQVGNMLTGITITPQVMSVKARNVRGKMNKVNLNKIIDRVDFSCRFVKNLSTIENLQAEFLTNEFIYFKLWETGFLHRETRISQTKTKINLFLTSRRFLTLNKVVLASDPEGFNYGGTINEDDMTLTTSTELPDSNTEVIVEYYYAGFYGSVDIGSINVFLSPETGYWEMNFTVEGK